jgi:hypothetical protein
MSSLCSLVIVSLVCTGIQESQTSLPGQVDREGQGGYKRLLVSGRVREGALCSGH